MTKVYAVVGAGPVGRATTAMLAERGDRVRLVSRSGTGPDVEGAERLGLDASDAGALSRAAEGAAAVLNCANPSDYARWAAVWPPLAESLLTAAEQTGATLVTAASLYAYGPVGAPMVEGQADTATDALGSIRRGMWEEALRRHRGRPAARRRGPGLGLRRGRRRGQRPPDPARADGEPGEVRLGRR